jgi:hypothetical protein
VLPLLLTGCRTSPGSREDRDVLRIDVVGPTLTPGTSAGVQLENLSDRTIGFNRRPKVIERGDGSPLTAGLAGAILGGRLMQVPPFPERTIVRPPVKMIIPRRFVA